ncbi:MAG: UDP-N-acetylmuramoylalanyl-D-glutamate--2,6-diaminopimelate ligase, partial [Spirochaetia bacterium]|nr:UDP-N-acetylmuramoylalanyl-D-glutamate--2,6-diaminopimelate ligase [Spirochaetia bacterium]
MARVGGFSNQRYPLAKVAAMCGGLVVRPSDSVVEDVQIDSRKCSPNSLFFALDGEKERGIMYVGDAAKRGCTAVVVRYSDKAFALAMVEATSCSV